MTHRFITGIFAGVFSIAGYAQSDSINQKFNLYSASVSDHTLFVHIDKTIYTNNENIWFSAYLIKNTIDLSSHNILSVELVREDTKDILAENKFLMENGLAFGSLTLPDSIPPGGYQFVAYTNVLDYHDKPVASFYQPVMIKSIKSQNIHASLSLIDTVVTSDGVTAKLDVGIDYRSKGQKPVVEYGVGTSPAKRVVMRDSTFRIVVQKEMLTREKPMLLVSVKYDDEIQYLSIPLPEVKPQGISVRFFPEGGHLVEGLSSRVGWEAKTVNGLPVGFTGILEKDGHPVDTLSTDNTGVGTFRIQPKRNSRYSLRIRANEYLDHDTLYNLPPVLSDGVVIQLEEGVVKDTLTFTLSGSRPATVRLLIHNYTTVFTDFSTVALPRGKRISVVLPEIKGLAEVTVLNEQGRPVAERMFYAHYDRQLSASIVTDKKMYDKKERVTMKIHVTDQAGTPVNAITSVAAIQDNRIDFYRHKRIDNYVYVDHFLGDLPPVFSLGDSYSKEYLENVLLVRGWRKYTWQDLLAVTPADTVQSTHSPRITATAQFLSKPVKAPVSFLIFRDSAVNEVISDNRGFVELSPLNLMVPVGRKVFGYVAGKDVTRYSITVDDGFHEINNQLASSVSPNYYGAIRLQQASSDLRVTGLERVTDLKEFVVLGNRYDEGNTYGTANVNACGDYVCMYNILNCPNHFNVPGNKAPIKGEYYTISGTTAQVMYNGCVRDDRSYMADLPAIFTEREFYGVDTDSTGMRETQYLSTLLWKPGVVVLKDQDEEMTFYTSDISGEFRVVVQGVGENGVVYGEAEFLVK